MDKNFDPNEKKLSIRMLIHIYLRFLMTNR